MSMKNPCVVSGAVVAALILCTVAASAQDLKRRPLQSRDSHEIALDVVVTGKSGPPVAGLAQSDFTVLDNNARVPLTSFRALGGSQAPVGVILVVDAVNAPYEIIARERGELDKFLRSDGGHLAHPTEVAIFTDKGTQIQRGFSRDGNGVDATLDGFATGLRTITRATGFYGAADRFQLSLNALDLLVSHEDSLPGRKIILWVSPGWPLLSGPGIYVDSKQERQIFDSIVKLSADLREAGITLYSIDPLGTSDFTRTFYYQQFVKGVSKPSQVDSADLSLQVLAVQSGGLALSSNNDIAAMLRRCLDDTLAYYEITFDSAPAEQRDQYHRIQIQVAKPGLTARTRQGYYAQP